MLGLLILLLFYGLGVVAQRYLHVPLPGNVIGMLLLLAGLLCGVVKVAWVETAAGVLMRHMMLFFAPLIVGVLGMTALLAESWLPLVATVVISTVVTLVMTAGVASAVGGNGDE